MVQETVSSAVDACLLCQVKDISPLETLMSERDSCKIGIHPPGIEPIRLFMTVCL